MSETSISVERKRGFVGSAIQFRVMLDGVEQGRLGSGDGLELQTAAGRHEVYVHTDGRVRSPTLTVHLAPGQHAQILSSSPSNVVGNLFRIFFRPGKTLEIELADLT